jgi:hypothetical protein
VLSGSVDTTAPDFFSASLPAGNAAGSVFAGSTAFGAAAGIAISAVALPIGVSTLLRLGASAGAAVAVVAAGAAAGLPAGAGAAGAASNKRKSRRSTILNFLMYPSAVFPVCHTAVFPVCQRSFPPSFRSLRPSTMSIKKTGLFISPLLSQSLVISINVFKPYMPGVIIRQQRKPRRYNCYFTIYISQSIWLNFCLDNTDTVIFVCVEAEMIKSAALTVVILGLEDIDQRICQRTASRAYRIKPRIK